MQQTFITKVRIVELLLKERKKVAEGTTEITLDTTGTHFTFKAGQYIRIAIPRLSADVPGGNTRDFTISSSPNTKDLITITFRESDSVFKKTLLKASEKTTLVVQGPLGVFTLPENPNIPIIFIAGGIGVTPALSMIRFVTEKNSSQKIHLVYANVSRESAAYLEELRTLSKKNSNIILTEKIGRVNVQFLKEQTKSTSNTLWYICGQPQMVLSLVKIIPEELGVSAFNIRTEEYVGYERATQGYKIPQPVEIESIKAKTKDREKVLNERIITPLLDAASQTALIAVTDVQGTIVYVNQKFINVSKYSREELIGQNHRILKSEFHPPSFYETLWKTISSGALWRGEIKNRAKDGTFYWVDTSITPIFGDNGKIEQYIAVRFLITDKKDLEESKKAILNILEDVEEEKEDVTKERDKINTILYSIGDGVFVVDTDYKIVLFNKMASNLSGWSTEEVIGKRYDTFLKFVFEESEKINNVFIKDAIDTGEVKEMTNHTILIKKDGNKIPVADSAAPVKDKDETIIGCVVVFRDITKEREIDRAKSEFVSLASHQLRTPLSSINWYTEMLLAGDIGKVTKEQKKYIEKVHKGNQRMAQLVSALLNVSRIELGTLALEPKPIILRRIAQDALEDLQPQITQKKLIIKQKYDPALPIISLDPKVIQIVFQNLLSNAVKYTPEGGTIHIFIEKKKQEAFITIMDTGYGIPKDQQDKIFTKLFRADNVREHDTDGTGLGLYIVKSMVKEAGGKIWFESPSFVKVSAGKQGNQGTTFFVTLPLKGMKGREGTKGLTTSLSS